jgi:hypothetical protein
VNFIRASLVLLVVLAGLTVSEPAVADSRACASAGFEYSCEFAFVGNPVRGSVVGLTHRSRRVGNLALPSLVTRVGVSVRTADGTVVASCETDGPVQDEGPAVCTTEGPAALESGASLWCVATGELLNGTIDSNPLLLTVANLACSSGA